MTSGLTEIDDMAFVGERPWHGRGTEVAPDATVEEVLDAAKLNWRVQKMRLRVVDGKVIKDHFGLIRSDTGECLDVVGKQYVPVSPEEAINFFKRFAEVGDLRLETAGSLCGGRWVFGLAKVSEDLKVGTSLSGDVMKNYILIVSPNIHGKSLVCKQTSIRVVCWNTMTASLGEAGTRIALRHVRAFDEEQQQAVADAVRLSTARFGGFVETANILADRKVTKTEALDYLRRVFHLDEESLAARRREDAKPRTSPILLKLEGALENSPGAKLATADGTLWGAFNAVTYLCDHQLGLDVDTRLRESWLGGRENTKRRALRLAEELV